MDAPYLLTLLFTQDLRGDLRFLPKLARVLWRLRMGEDRTLTLDLGGMCAPEVWHCAATGGRSMLIALDGLNYAAVNAEGLPPEARPSLNKSLIYMQPVDSAHPGQMPIARFVSDYAQAGAEASPLVTLVLRPSSGAAVRGRVIEFPAVEAHKIGRLRVRIDGDPEILSLDTFDVPPDTPPDPTISGMIDFIESEARQYGKRRSQS